MARKPPDTYIHSHLRGLRHSATVAISEHSHALIAEGRRIYRLGLGQSPFPVPAPVVEALRAHAAEKEYLPVRGLYELRRAIAHYTERKAGIDRTAEDVLVGPGAKPLAFLLQLVFRGDVIVPTPAWTSYAAQARVIGRPVRWLHTRPEDHFMITPEALAAALSEESTRPRLVHLSYPNNPTGATLKIDQLKALAAVAREHDALVLSDEIYAELHHKGKHVSIARYYPEGTIISTGLSKWCGAGGWRLGAFVFPERLRGLLDSMSAVASETFTGTSAPIQYAAVRAFEGGEVMERYLVNARRICSALGRWCARKLRGAGVECPQPIGAFYLFADFGPLRERLAERGIHSARDLSARLLSDVGVATLPGSDFGRPDAELTCRLAYVDFDGTKALEAVDVIPQEQPLDHTFLKRHCRPVVSAIEAIAGWIEAP
ncbi:MAG: aminotransferase class I/II-fold pyridoxal phosphate-dependent enzyme [Sandaracinaceae bacterium]|nr:aminotransferase class I/II-fold pyridoxal phosphate-dependent enzyme [Sandaracinaceae bacterium]